VADRCWIFAANKRGGDESGAVVIEFGGARRELSAMTDVSGRRLLAALAIGLTVGAVASIGTYYALRLLTSLNPQVAAQLIVVEVYALLTSALMIAFRPVQKPPLGIRLSGFRDLSLALGAWLGIVAISALAYSLLKPAFGGVTESLRRILIVATDVKRLQGQPKAAWAIAIPRGCLLVPFFEELFFRGALLQWLRRHVSDLAASLLSAVLFAGMHVYPVAMPYAFLFGSFSGWVRVRTGSTLNTVFMHVLNNFVFLYLGFLLLR
jgi:uncharacterized protein